MADEWPHLDGWWASAASTLVLEIDRRLSKDWERIHDGDGMWRWVYPDDDIPQGIAVNGRDDAKILVPYHGWRDKVGPTVIGYRHQSDALVSVTLPTLCDSSDIREALSVLTRVISGLGSGLNSGGED